MGKQLEVHITKEGTTFTVRQEGTLLVPDLTWEQALSAAEALGGKIIVHDQGGDRVINLNEKENSTPN